MELFGLPGLFLFVILPIVVGIVALAPPWRD